MAWSQKNIQGASPRTPVLARFARCLAPYLATIELTIVLLAPPH